MFVFVKNWNGDVIYEIPTTLLRLQADVFNILAYYPEEGGYTVSWRKA